MKKSILVLAISLLSASAALAADLSLEQNTADLGACDGVAKLVKTSDGHAEIRIQNVRRCSNVTLQMKLDRKSQGEYSITLPVSLGKEADLQLSSNSGSTSTRLSVSTVEVDNTPELFAGQHRELKNCLGTIHFSTTGSRPNLYFDNVKNCNHLKVVSVNGHAFSYETSLHDMGATWGGAIALPTAAVSQGRNHVKVSVEGPMNQDQFVLVFDNY